MTLPNLSKDITQYVDIAPTGGKQNNYSITALAGSNLSNTVSAQITPLFAPTLSTPVVGSVTSSSAAINCSVTSDGGSAITAHGICWSTTQDPTIAGNKTNDGSGAGTYTSAISGLTAGATYYARAYATNSQGTAYSAQITFTASPGSLPAKRLLPQRPPISPLRPPLWAVTQSQTVTLQLQNGESASAPVPIRPLQTNSRIPSAGLGIFASNFSAMQSGTTYYVRAYAINSKGTAYGNEISFATAVVLSLATVTTSNATAITSTSATLGGNVTADGNTPVTERGVYFGTTQNPTTQNKYSNGAGLGSYNFNFTGMTPNTTYYVRAYAVNSLGMAFGNEISFTTSALPLSLPTVTTAAATNITTSTATLGGTVTADGNAPVTERGICVSASRNPTTLNKYPNGSGLGSFASNATGMADSTTYYVRAYAINSVGTAYGGRNIFYDSKPAVVHSNSNYCSTGSMSAVLPQHWVAM